MRNEKLTQFPFPISRACNFTLLYRLTAINTTENRNHTHFLFDECEIRDIAVQNQHAWTMGNEKLVIFPF